MQEVIFTEERIWQKFGAPLDWLLVAASHETMGLLLLFSNAWEANYGSELSASSTRFKPEKIPLHDWDYSVYQKEEQLDIRKPKNDNIASLFILISAHTFQITGTRASFLFFAFNLCYASLSNSTCQKVLDEQNFSSEILSFFSV